MTKIKWTVAALVIAGLASPISNADAKSHKHHKGQSSAMTDTNKKMTDKNNTSTATTGTNKSPGTTTGANIKSSSGNPSTQGKTP